MRKSTIVSIALLALFGLLFQLAQTSVIDARQDRRVEEKILMLSERPEITKVLSLGFESAAADLLWIRAIQYFGGNFSTLDKPGKRDGMINLFNNLMGLDPHFTAACKFGGFVMNEAIKDSSMAVDFLLRGAEKNPTDWRLRFDAGFIAFYQLKDFDFAKSQFLYATYGENMAARADADVKGVPEGFSKLAAVDGDSLSDTGFNPDRGSILLDFREKKTVGRVQIEQSSVADQSFRLSYSAGNTPDAQAFTVIPSVTQAITKTLTEPIQARYIKLDEMKTDDPNGFFMINELRVFGPPNPEVPPYVERMAYEMDRNAGRFKAAWNQYNLYMKEQLEKDDQISAELSAQKLEDIYSAKCIELLQEAVKLYQEELKELPSPRMNELVEKGYLQRIIEKKDVEDPYFANEVLYILLYPDHNIWRILNTWQGNPFLEMKPHILIAQNLQEGSMDWYIISRRTLEDQQATVIATIQKGVDQYKEEEGKLPDTLEALTEKKYFSASTDIFHDPLGGEFFLDKETGKVEARNPKY